MLKDGALQLANPTPSQGESKRKLASTISNIKNPSSHHIKAKCPAYAARNTGLNSQPLDNQQVIHHGRW